jgi:polyisoprenoid-binding protein YceI
MSEHTTTHVDIERDADLPPAGDWVIDAAHSTVGFWVRHLGFTKVRGRFTDLSGAVHIGNDGADSSADVVLVSASIDTNEADRDAHLRSADFLDAENHPTLRFTSTSVVQQGRTWTITGSLTIRGVSRTVGLDAEFGGAVVDPWGDQHLMFTAQTVIQREDFGLTWNQALETGGVLVGKAVTIELEVSLVAAA